MRRFSLFILFLSASAGAVETSIELGQDTWVTEDGRPAVLHKKGEKLELGVTTSAWLEAPGYAGVLIPALRSRATQLKVTLKPIETRPETAKQINAAVNDVADRLSNVQSLVAKKRTTEALAAAEEAARKYPDVALLQFLRASCLVLEKAPDRAVAVLREALRTWPDDVKGRALYDSLVAESESAQ